MKAKRWMQVAACAGGLAAVGTGVGASPALAVGTHAAATKYTFRTLDNPADPTFNQLLGINDHGVIAGYFGDGTNNPNKGYTLASPYSAGDYTNENFPLSAQTQVTGIDGKGDTVGFYVNSKNSNFGFVDWNGVFTSVSDPSIPSSVKVKTTQLLGINNAGIAVGFYLGANGNSHGFEYNQATNAFTPITIPGGTNVTATGINNDGTVVGFYEAGSGNTEGFLMEGTTILSFEYPGSTTTTPFGVNSGNEVVGSYLDSSGTHGFTLLHPIQNPTYKTLDDPNGIGNTVINGVNDSGDLVGFYVDSAGNTDGFLAQH
jgi:probable HAF family extracellular repeat protein